MNRKIRIAPALALAGFLSVSAPLAASASTPMLSGYGGPGAGEQAIVGSTLLVGPRGGSGSSSSGLGGSGAASSSASTATGGSRAGASRAGGSSAATSSTSPTSKRAARGARRAGEVRRSSGVNVGGVQAYLYPKSPSSSSSASHVIGISGDDVFPLVGIVVALALIGVFTVRFVRLQP